MQIDYRAGSYRATGDHDPVIMKKHGWNFIPSVNEWRTSQIPRVIPFVDFCVGEAAKRVVPLVQKRRAEIAASVASTADIVIPIGKKAADAGKAFRGYQKGGVAFARQRFKSLNGDVPRLGKTIQAIGLANTHPVGEIKHVLAITPANAKINWCERWDEWSAHPLGVDYIEGSHNPKSPVLVVNWDLVSRHINYLMGIPWDIVVADEIHRLAHSDSQRTRAILGDDGKRGIPALKHWLMLSGNPMGTRPLNMWPMLQFMDPNGLGKDKWAFRKRFCGASADNQWDSNGSSNEEELQYLLRASIMVRRDMGDVGDEVPPNRTTVRLPKDGLSRLIRAERNAVQQSLDEFETLVRSFSKDAAARIEQLAAEVDQDEEPVDAAGMAVQDLTLAALPMMIDFIKEQRETEKKVIVFCHHRAVAKRLHEAFPGCAFVVGGMATTKREAERVRFQTDPNCHEFIGNISACCENLELSASDVVIFCELVWQTWQLDQAEMRPWLPGKTVPIQVFRLVVDSSASAEMADLLELRQAGIERATVAKRMAGVVS